MIEGGLNVRSKEVITISHQEILQCPRGQIVSRLFAGHQVLIFHLSDEEWDLCCLPSLPHYTDVIYTRYSRRQ